MSESLNSEADKLFNSVVLEEYPPVEWKTRRAEGFTVFAPSEVKKMPKDSVEDSNREHFISYDETQSVSYDIFKYPISPYYWTKNDSAFFEEKINAYKTDGDTVIRQAFSFVGNLKSLDLLIKNAGSHNIKKQKIFVNGDTLYIMLCFMPDIYINKENHQKFFSDFKITHEVIPGIYTNKASSLLEALKSQDSVTREKAISALSSASFDKGDLHLLHNALLQIYPDSINSYTIENTLTEILNDLADSTTINFIAGNYAGNNDVIKKQLLRVLANIHTTAGYLKLKEILLSSLPKKVDLSFLKYSLTDSLLLAKKLYPEILQLSHDSSFASVLVSLNNTLLDSSLISIDEVRPFENHYYKHAKSHLALLKQSTEQWWEYSSLISFLGKLNNKNANDLLQEYLQIPSGNIKMEAALALIKNEQPVLPAHMQKIADEKPLRASLYYQLQQLDKEVFFPAVYAKQQALAESDIFQMASDDYEVGSQSFIGERTIQYEGKAKKFYLFKITYNNEADEQQSYLGITGPYDIKTRELVPFSNACGIYWKEEFNKKNLESEFKAYLSDLSDLEN